MAAAETAKEPVTAPVDDIEHVGAGLDANMVEAGLVASMQDRELPVAKAAPSTATVPSEVPKPRGALWATPSGVTVMVGVATFVN